MPISSEWIGILIGPAGLLVGLSYAVYWLQKELKATRRCEDPDKDPCGVCQLCKGRAYASGMEQKDAAFLKGLEAQRSEFTEALKLSEEKHQAEVERERTDKLYLQERLLEVLRMIDGLPSHKPGSGVHDLPKDSNT